MSPERYSEIRQAVVEHGFAGEIEWQQNVQAPEDADAFAMEIIFVICNSGMKAQVAREIFRRVHANLMAGKPVEWVFRHKLKCRAIEAIWKNRYKWFDRYINAPTAAHALDVLSEIDHLGPITKYHAAKNFGLDVVKPDRHLARLAASENTTPDELCAKLAAATGDRKATVDYVLWRACNLGIIRL